MTAGKPGSMNDLARQMRVCPRCNRGMAMKWSENPDLPPIRYCRWAAEKCDLTEHEARLEQYRSDRSRHRRA